MVKEIVCEYVDWIRLAQDRVQIWALVKTNEYYVSKKKNGTLLHSVS
jgi:hypothetical protein